MTSEDNSAEQDSAKHRGEILRRLGLMSPDPEADFDELVSLAAIICEKPLGAMTLLDETTQLMKARVGFTGSRTMAVRDSICQYTVRGDSLTIVEDVGSDPRFRDNKIISEDSGIRFYAGMPLVSEDGHALGALCVMDVEPSTLSAAQQSALAVLGRQLSHQIQQRERAQTMERMVLEREREQVMFSTILDHVPAVVYLKDSSGHIRFYNRALAERFSIDREFWLGKTSHDLWDKETADRIVAEEQFILHSLRPHESVVTTPGPDGAITQWKNYKAPCQNADGEPMLSCCSIDLTEPHRRELELLHIREELEEANHKLSSLALTDALTGLWNRRAFNAQIETGIMAAQRSKLGMALMLIDADHFKSINDRHGHPYGDSVLRNLAVVLNRVKRAEDVACRFGGEEFAVLLPVIDIAAANVLAQRFMDALRLFPWEKEPVTVSIGLAMCSDTCTSDELIDDADAALYRAKHEGRNRVVLHSCEKK
jgi:diguanylate cyclase (GGDEF)-like protein/PAS domain S-box-containing protein